MDLPPVDPFRTRDWPAPPDATVDLAVVGLGAFSTDWVIPSITAADAVNLGAVVSGSPATASEIAETHDAVALSYEAYADGTATDRYDAVYVLTPNATHLDHVTTAADHGKHVLCEKPVEVTTDRARRVRDTCQDAGVLLQVAYRLQIDPVVRWARRVVATDVIGDPVHAQGTMAQDLFTAVDPDPNQWRLDHDRSGGAALIDLGIYPLNTLRFLTDQDPVAVSATTTSPDPRFSDVDQHTTFTARFDDGLLGAGTASQLSATADHLHLVGTEGTLRLDPAFFGDVTATVRVRDAERTVSIDSDEMREQLDYFASHVLRATPPEPDGDHAIVDARTIDAAYRSAAVGETIAIED